MAKQSVGWKNWPKYLLQWGTLAALIFFLSGLAEKIFPKMAPADPEAYCPMGGLEALVTFASRGSLPCSMSSLQIMMGIVLAAAVIFFSKLFCAYLCPIGSFEDILIKLRKVIRLKSINIRVGGIADKVLRIVKYVILFWIFTMTMSASELFCKNLDPYYAVATGFKGEITLWMSIVTLTLVVLGGLVVDRFWCRYICPLGAISNSLKFWLWMLVLVAAFYVANLFGAGIPWSVMLGAFCLVGYLLEILSGKPKLQVLSMMKNDNLCNHCGRCERYCPYHIEISSFEGRIDCVDCTLCGECAAACKQDALHVGFLRNTRNNPLKTIIPAVLTVVLLIVGIKCGKKFEVPTINETWGIEAYDKDSTLVQLVNPDSLKTFTMENMKSVKCFGSSKAFAARLQKIKGTNGVKTYVGSHKVVIKYNPAKTSEEEIRSLIFVPSHFRVNSPSPAEVPLVKIQTIRVEKMYDKMDLNYLGLQMRLTGKKIYGLESEYDCPVIVRVYSDPSEALDKEWFKEIVNKKVLSMPVKDGYKDTPLDLEFVKLEKEESTMGIDEYLHRMFDGFKAEFNGRYLDSDGNEYVKKRAEVYEGKPQFIYEIPDQNYEKPIITRSLPFLSNWLSSEEGVIGVYLALNKDLVPSIQVRFAEPATADKIWKMMKSKTWKITYSREDVREESARMKFEKAGYAYPYEK